MTETGPKCDLRRLWWQRVVPQRARLLRNYYFWMVAGIVLLATATLSAFLSFTDRAILGFVLLSWLIFSAIFVARSILELHDVAPTIPDVAKWNQYDVDVRELAAKVRQRRKAKNHASELTKKVAHDQGWKRGALASATVSIRSRSFFRDNEEGPDESVIASQISVSN